MSDTLVHPAKRPTTIADLLRFRIPSTPRLSPDTKSVAFVLRSVDAEHNRTIGRIAVVPTDASKAFTVWTSGGGSESDPQWSTDGRFLGFVSTRDDKRGQVFRIPVDGGEAVPVTRLGEGSLLDWCWSPDSSRLAVLFRPVDPAHSKDETERRSREHRSTPPRMIDNLRWRMEGTGFLSDVADQVIIVDLATGDHQPWEIGGGRDVSGLTWTPDGSRLLVHHSIADDPDRTQSDDGFFLVDVDKGLVEAVAAVRGPKGNAVFSPDGRWIAWLGHDGPDETWGVRNNGLWIRDQITGQCRNLTADWDVHVGDCTLSELHGKGDTGPFWSPDSQSMTVLVSDQGRTFVWRIGIDGNRELLHENVSGLSAVGTEMAVLAVDSDHAGDIHYAGRQLTRVNDALLSEIYLQKPLAVAPPAPDGLSVPCFVLLPPDAETTQGPWPTLVYIHGGPHLMYGATHLFHEFQALAAAGYVVLFPNPRGSKGYGEAWTAAIRGDWGKPAMDDVMACVDYAVARGWADPERLGVVGGSYGGYLTAWIVGHTDRFRAAAPERGVYDLVSMAGTCDFPWKDHDYFRADTHANSEEYRRNSPLTYAGNVTTPTLVIHSEGDLRCPISQAEQYFRALSWEAKAPVRFLRYGPEANHDLSRGGPPDLRIHRQEQIHAWFDRYLKAGLKEGTQ